MNPEISEPGIEIDVHAENDSVTIPKVETADMNEQELRVETEKDTVISEVVSAMSELNDLMYTAEIQGKICKEAIEHHSLLVEKVLENAVGDDNDADDGTWKDVFDAANQKTDHLAKAQVSLISSIEKRYYPINLSPLNLFANL